MSAFVILYTIHNQRYTGQQSQHNVTEQHGTHLELLVERLNAVLLAGEAGTRVPVLRGQVEHLGVALLPHLCVRVQRQVAVSHAMLHVLHFLLEQCLGLPANSTNAQTLANKPASFTIITSTIS